MRIQDTSHDRLKLEKKFWRSEEQGSGTSLRLQTNRQIFEPAISHYVYKSETAVC